MKLSKRYDSEYVEWFNELKIKIQSTQIKAVLSANNELIFLYWEFGKELHQKQEEKGWGNAVVESLAKDLKKEFPYLKGFSRRNLFYMKSFYSFYNMDFVKVQQLVAQIPWGHNIRIISKSKSVEEAMFYLNAAFENNWSRDILAMQIETEYALRGISQPIGVAEYQLSKVIPENIKSELPSIQELELSTARAIKSNMENE